MPTTTVALHDADEIEKLFLETTGMKPGYLQLSAGRAGIELRVVELAGVSLIWTRGWGRARWLDDMTGDGLHLGLALESEGPITQRGRRIGPDHAQVWMPGLESDLVMGGPNLTLEVGVEADLVEQLGWRLAGDPLREVPKSRLARLVGTCRRASASEDPVWRDQVLEDLEPVLEPWLLSSEREAPSSLAATRQYLLVKSADDFLESLGDEAPFEVDSLADALGVSRRTVFHAYRQLLGVGPRRYFELKRLQSLRSRLKDASPGEETVTTVAQQLGFRDLGRMAARYRSRFGENPSDTLRRAG